MKLNKRNKSKLGKLTKYFKSDNWEQVSNFLDGDEKVAKFILEIRIKILKFFPKCNLALNILKTERLGANNPHEMCCISIKSPGNMKTKESADRLGKFDDIWWLENSTKYENIMVDIDIPEEEEANDTKNENN